MNPLPPGHSGTTPEPSRNALNTSQGTNENDSQNDPRPEAGPFRGQLTQNSGPEDGHDKSRSFSSGFWKVEVSCSIFIHIIDHIFISSRYQLKT